MISCATASALPRYRSATHTAVPSLANRRAWAPPIPPPPPVITATLPSSFMSNQPVVAINLRLIRSDAAVEYVVDPYRAPEGTRLANGERRGQIEQTLRTTGLGIPSVGDHFQKIE